MFANSSMDILRDLLNSTEYRGVLRDDGSVAVPSADIFRKLSNAMPISCRFTPKYIYTILKMNRHSLHDHLLKLHGIQFEPPQKFDSSLDESIKDKICFTLDVTDIWDTLGKEYVAYEMKNRGTRVVTTLRRGTWTNVLFDKIILLYKLPCALTFKRCRISGSGIALKIEAICNECSCQLYGQIASEPLPEEACIMECELVNFDEEYDHSRKRQLKGSKRSEVSTEMVEKKILPCIWRRNLASKIMDIGDKEPPTMFSQKTLQKAKQQKEDELLDVSSKNAIESLHSFKYNMRSEGAIRAIGLDPLFVHYWLNEQIAVYQKFHERICIDATGSLVKKIRQPDGDLSSHIYLYQAVTAVGDKHAPIFQMISSVQNTNSITFWLLEFLRIGSLHKATFPIPKEVITDFDKALLGAVVKAFNKMSCLKEYLNYCFQIISEPDLRLPPCLIRLDICHFINMIVKWNCWTRVSKRARIFYIRSIAILREQDNFQDFECHAKNIFCVALDANLGPNSASTKALEYLIEKIRGITDEYNSPVSEGEEENEEEPDGDIYVWSNNIYESCKSKVADEIATDETPISGYYCPAVAIKLKKILPYFPLYTEIMPAIFKYGQRRATSAPVESEFNDLKNRILKDYNRPMRVDKFIIRHVESFPGKIKLVLSNVKCTKDSLGIKVPIGDDRPESNLSDSEDITENQVQTDDEIAELNQEQNWRNKNKKIKLIKYIDHSPNFDPNLTINRRSDIPIIVNGNYCRNISQGKDVVVVKNTCAFDSLCQIIAVAIKRNPAYGEATRQWIEDFPLLDCAHTIHNLPLLYSKRASLLLNLPIYAKETKRTSIIRLEAQINVENLAVALFTSLPSALKRTRCSICGKSSTTPYPVVPVNYNKLRMHGFQNLQNAIETFNYKCCSTEMGYEMTYASQIIVESDLCDKTTTKLRHIPEKLNLEGKYNFIFAGVIAYRGPFKSGLMGHYLAYVRSWDSNWILFDGNTKNGSSKFVTQDEEIYARSCIYIKTDP